MSTKTEYVERLKAKLDEWNAAIDALEAKARQSEAQARQKYFQQVSDLKAKRGEAEQKLDQVRNASDDAWHTLKDGADQVWDRMSTTLKETKQAFLDGMK